MSNIKENFRDSNLDKRGDDNNNIKDVKASKNEKIGYIKSGFLPKKFKN